MIKLLHLYRFHDLKNSKGFDFSGIWETFECKDFSSNSPTWGIRRVASFTTAPVGEKTHLPNFILEGYASAVDRDALRGCPVSDEKINDIVDNLCLCPKYFGNCNFCKDGKCLSDDI